MSIIKKIKIDDAIYEANVEFRNIIKANEIAQDDTLHSIERAYGVLCTIFGVDSIDNDTHANLLLKWVKNYLTGGKEVEDREPDMDYVEDMDYIEASFMSDYNIDLENTEMDWLKFNNLINGLSYSDFGNCCILNRIRNLRNYDVSKIQDPKERDKIIKAQKEVELKKTSKENNLSKEQEESMEKLNKLIGI